MKGLLRGSDMIGLPVVTMSGDDVAEVREVLFDSTAGNVLGFRLNKRGRLKGRMKESLGRAQVAAVGPDAVMVQDADALLVQEVTAGGDEPTGDVLGDRVMTDGGVQVGTVTDVVIDTAGGAVVGFEVAPLEEASGRHGRRSYVPLPDTGAVSGEAVMVPASAIEYVTSDFAGFGEAVDRFRTMMREGRR
jgi:uncharacterized protein YrrD